MGKKDNYGYGSGGSHTTSSGTNSNVRVLISLLFVVRLVLVLTCSFYREITGAPVLEAAVLQAITTPTGTFPHIVFIKRIYADSMSVFSDGGYYYNNPNGSTYYETGKGSYTYTTPSGHTVQGQK
jgi:hypothetical protein